MVNLFFDMVRITITGSLVYVTIIMMQPLTQKLSSCWQYSMLKCSALLFVIPTIKLVNTFFAIFKKSEIFILSPLIKTSNLSHSGTNYYEASEIVTTTNNYVQFLSIVMLIWLIGIIVLSSWRIYCFIRFKNELSKYYHVVNNEFMLSLLKKCSEELGVTKKVKLLTHESIVSPMVVGLINPKIVLPKGDISNSYAEYIFKHELSHIKSNDLWIKV